MRVSLQIDGDASGAKQAAQEASGAIGDLGKQTDAISKAIEDGFAKARGAIGNLANASQAAGAANDNTANSALGLASKLSQLAGAASGADSALAKGAAGAVSFAKGFGDVLRSAGAFNIIGGVIGLAVNAASTFYGVISAGSAESSKHIDDTTSHINAANTAYTNAAKAAGAYFTQVNNVAILESNLNLRKLKADQLKDSDVVAGKLTPRQTAIFSGAIPGEDFSNGLSGALFPDQANDRFKAFQGLIDELNASIAAGNPQWEKFAQGVAAAGNAAVATNPQIAELAGEAIKIAAAKIKGAAAISEEERNLRLYTGTATKADLATRGLSSSANENAGAFDRLAKSMDRQSASQAAEALTAGLGAGAAAKLRTEFILTEAAQQSGIKVAGAYADKIAAIAARSGEAAQKLAFAKLQSDTAFTRDQLGRNTIDASVADQLKGAFGNNADLNSDVANAVRFNEQMKDLKGTVSDVANGAFGDFRNAVQGGATAMQALGTVSMNVLNKIIDKLGNKVLDNGISALFGAFMPSFGGGGGSIGGAATSTGAAGVGGLGGLYDRGGYTGAGGKYERAGIVHKGEVVFSQDDVQRHGGVHAVEMLRTMSGYAGGGPVGGPAPWGSQPFSAQRQSNTSSPPTVAVNVNVANNNGSDVSVQQERNSSGGVDLTVLVQQAVDQNVANGRHDKTLASRYGLRPAVGAR